jgi:hypothetical protein
MSKTLFVRESSGLKKEVSALDAIMLNLGNMSAGVALFTGISPYIPQGGIIWIAAIIGLLLTIPQAIMYTLLSYRIPRTGGDYVWISRILNGPLGVVMAFALNAGIYSILRISSLLLFMCCRHSSKYYRYNGRNI